MAAADKIADPTVFIEFMLCIIRDALNDLLKAEQVREQVTVQVEKLLAVLGSEILSTKELLARLGLKHRPTFTTRYLHPALKLGLIEMTIPDKPNSSKQKYRKVRQKLNRIENYTTCSCSFLPLMFVFQFLCPRS